MKKLTREQILQVIRKEVRFHESQVESLREKATVLLTGQELIDIAKSLEGEFNALGTLNDVMQAVAYKESLL